MVSRLSRLGSELNALVIGANGAIGHALVTALDHDPAVAQVIAGSRQPRTPSTRVRQLAIDVTDQDSVRAAAATLSGHNRVDVLIVATGVLHDGAVLEPEKRWEDIDADRLARAFAVNATGPALVARHFAPLLSRNGRSVFAVLSARVGSIGDNRLGGWYAYRASKAALNMLIRTLSIELARRNPAALAVALHPGTVDTPLSKPFQSGVASDRLFAPEHAAANLLDVIGKLDETRNGTLIAWNGETLPW